MLCFGKSRKKPPWLLHVCIHPHKQVVLFFKTIFKIFPFSALLVMWDSLSPSATRWYCSSSAFQLLCTIPEMKPLDASKFRGLSLHSLLSPSRFWNALPAPRGPKRTDFCRHTMVCIVELLLILWSDCKVIHREQREGLQHKWGWEKGSCSTLLGTCGQS